MPDGLIALALAAAISSLVVAGIVRHGAALPHAHPSARSLHDRPIPRVGGLAIWLAALPVAIVWPPAVSGNELSWIVAWAAVTGVSLADDWRQVSVRIRLVVHATAAFVLASVILGSAGGDGGANMALIALAAAGIVWGMNLFNFMDGSDGLAGTMAATGFGAFAAALAARGEPWIACAALVVAATVFLAANRPPAALFLGDVGAVPLGLLATAMGLDGVARGTWPWWFPVLAFLPFLLDASTTLVRRLLQGERVADAHRSHYYQRLVQLGFGHAGTLAVYGALMVAGALAAVGCLVRMPAAGPYALGVLGAVHVIMFATIDYHWKKQAETR